MFHAQATGHAHKMGHVFAIRIMMAMIVTFSSTAQEEGFGGVVFAIAMMASMERNVKWMSARTAEFSTILARLSRFAQGMACAQPIGGAFAKRELDGIAP